MCLRKSSISVNARLCPEYYTSMTGCTNTAFTVDVGTLILEVKKITSLILNNLFIVTPTANTKVAVPIIKDSLLSMCLCVLFSQGLAAWLNQHIKTCSSILGTFSEPAANMENDVRSTGIDPYLQDRYWINNKC